MSAPRSRARAFAVESASSIESAHLYREATENALERELQLAAEIRAAASEAMQSGAHIDVARPSIPFLRSRRLLRLFQLAAVASASRSGTFRQGCRGGAAAAMIHGAFASQNSRRWPPAA